MRNPRSERWRRALSCYSNPMEPSLPSDRIVAVGLLTERDVNLLGPTFRRLWPIESAPSFVELLKAIDEAERELRATERSKATPGN